jgi:uncharacterized protein (TIGR00251 family)
MREGRDVLTPHPEGVLVEVWVVAGAMNDQVGGIHDGALRVRTTAPAEAGKANRAVGRLVAGALGGKRGSVVSGSTSRRKRVLVEGVTVAEARGRLR